MRIWHKKLISKLCQKHLCAMWREGLGAYKIITEKRTDISYYNHPATIEFRDAPEALFLRLQAIRAEMLARGYKPKELPLKVSFSGQVKEWQDLDTQIKILKEKKCNCDI